MIVKTFNKIFNIIKEEKEYLIYLDQAFGDGDLGISMYQGFEAVNKYLEKNEEKDLGNVFRNISVIFNESAPSSLGTIISFFFFGMAKKLKGNMEINKEMLSIALLEGLNSVKSKTNAKVSEKTIIDSIEPAILEFAESKDYEKAYLKAKSGMEETKNMMAIYGRAQYHKEKTIGHIDGGAYVGYLIFKAIYEENNSF